MTRKRPMKTGKTAGAHAPPSPNSGFVWRKSSDSPAEARPGRQETRHDREIKKGAAPYHNR